MSVLMFCPQCGTTAYPGTTTPGSIIVEAALWLLGLALCVCFWPLFLLGLVYSLWRLASRHKACAACGYRDIIPADSPRARDMLSGARR